MNLKKNYMTITKHRKLGIKIQRSYRGLLRAWCILSNTYGISSRQSKAAQKAIDTLSNLKNIMDDRLFFECEGYEGRSPYYGDSQKKK